MTAIHIPWSPPNVGYEEMLAAKKVIDSGWWTQGKTTKQFEEDLAKKIGCKHAIVVNNGTSALIAALLAHGVGPGDEVIVPTYTFIATINAVLAVGAKPVLVDCDKSTFNTTPELVAEKITKKTKAIMPVDVAGMPVDIDAFSDLAKDKEVVFIQDSAESIGARYKGRNLGSFDHTSAFSFHMAKLVTTTEGGCILTNDEETAKKIAMIRNHGMEGKYDHASFGLNFRITDIQSAIGREQLKKLDDNIILRNKLANMYKEGLSDLVEFQNVPPCVTTHPYMLFGVLVDKEKRDHIIAKLNQNGVDTRICWPPVHHQRYHKHLFEGTYPSADHLGTSIINLPMGNGLQQEHVRYVIETLRRIMKEER